MYHVINTLKVKLYNRSTHINDWRSQCDELRLLTHDRYTFKDITSQDGDLMVLLNLSYQPIIIAQWIKLRFANRRSRVQICSYIFTILNF